ncbi:MULTISPECIES: MFS transporter [Acidobacterium]|uniref:Transporter, major facilitator superfamily n=1 Tax=Acidobacterium capsulatum (strain ATCC 51196 / DSM 11244 / BCRC 80197 / JCM 7670 / NBRC 15755 / NCIMB 13165 / 161) TaxID=240015 RepID=C1F5H0_ACIC5|nr:MULTISPECIES: MFS transporter [Acidobacterium]ACO31532.1 transporter, major facilitator superfamily [Acidobacterium capsulatum ATCC 51196]HCT60818.1 MFS transporter [Acidobacterium sp.]
MAKTGNTVFYRVYLLLIAGLGGLLYGIDVGIIAAALVFLNKTVNLTLEQTSMIVAAVLGGSMLSSPAAGVLADWFGRKKMMVVSGLMFVASVGLIVTSQSFVPLFLGRLLQGMSGGVIAVVVPLYLAETLDADVRGRGTAIFQFMLTFGIVMASLIGYFYTHQAEAAIAHAAGHAGLILAAENHAWRGMFLAVIYPGIIFFAGAFFLHESPRWLFRRGRVEAAGRALERTMSREEAAREIEEMQTVAAAGVAGAGGAVKERGSLLRRKYVLPFLLACLVLALNTATGINSVLAFVVVILMKAGWTATHATQGDVAVVVLNCVMTLVGVSLIDKKGRRFLLRIGTGGIVLSLALGAAIFFGFESQQTNVTARVASAVHGDTIALPVNTQSLGVAAKGANGMALTVVYRYGKGQQITTVQTNTAHPELRIAPKAAAAAAPLVIERAMYGPLPARRTGWMIALCLAGFIACYAAGPGVVVWLMLSELMPTRIRSMGMGIALLLNQGVSTMLAAIFLPVAGNYGYYAMFALWAVCAAAYFLTATTLLPETKGKTLEEIEVIFDRV